MKGVLYLKIKVTHRQFKLDELMKGASMVKSRVQKDNAVFIPISNIIKGRIATLKHLHHEPREEAQQRQGTDITGNAHGISCIGRG
jgi:hypothetical protein